MSRAREFLRAHGPVLASVAVSVAWTAAALRAPTTTYHFLPGMVSAAWPITARLLRGPQALPAAIRAAVGGFVVAGLTTAELAGLGALDGPALIGGSGAAESAIVASAGAVWGARAAARAQAGLALRMLGATDQSQETAREPT